MPEAFEDYAWDFLTRAGLDPTEELVEQLRVFCDALRVYDDRTASYGQVWEQYGAVANLINAARKVDRLMECWWHNPDGAKALAKDGLDDAIDLLNYTAFFVRLAREGSITGEAPYRPGTLTLFGDDNVVHIDRQ